MHISKGKIIKYAILPEFFPRIRGLVGSGFIHISYLMALIFHTARLLPSNHPYLQPQNVGRFGIRHVLAEASNNLVFSRKNIDQIVIFFTILTGIVILLMQFIMIGFSLLAQPALAFGFAPYTDWFVIPSAHTPYDETQDIAFMLLDRVFGMQQIFNSCVSTGGGCTDARGIGIFTPPAYPFSLHLALHQMFRFYSWGIGILSVFILVYFVTSIVGETAVTGTPFGKRFNRAWAVPRVIVFFALLAPLNIGDRNEGLNGAQIITMWTAKFGSNMATNGWARFNNIITTTYLGDLQNLVATPNIPEIGSLVQFFFVAKTCAIAERVVHDRRVDAWLVRNSGLIPASAAIPLIPGMTYDIASIFSEGGNITIRFGVPDPDRNQYKDQIEPTCGEVKLHSHVPGASLGTITEDGALTMHEQYFQLLQLLWFNPIMDPFAECIIRTTVPIQADTTCALPDQFLISMLITAYESLIESFIANAVNDQLGSTAWAVPPTVLEKGWAGAAIWYNRVAQMNGSLTTAVLNIPRPNKYPILMEEVLMERRKNNEDMSGPFRFDPLLANGRQVDLGRSGDQYMVAALYKAFRFWQTDDMDSSPETYQTGNIVIDTINSIFGTTGLFEMRKNTDIHPLAQLSALGKGIIEAAIRNTLFATAGVVGGSLSDILDPFVGNLVRTASSFFFTVVMAVLVIGIILFYVLPFLPFIYFFFAISGWVKSIFEAMVAMPLWALAHMRIDGEGLPGPGATNGYFLLFEIFVRPTLIIFGFLASVSIFSALVMVLNDIFDLVVANLTGYDMEEELTGGGPSTIEYYRSAVDEFFFTVIYVIIVYMMALSSFKLIDLIPNNILRWMGITVATFQEGAGDPASQLTGQVYRGVTIMSSQASGSLSGGRLTAILYSGS